ncbi:glycosyltransferase family 2 protein [Ligilactobacillus apodemi]|uniref:glycosyltransferase family 2 protein n=1 Tax=Ligilactobacillus apodemi TaxID=307126 RepID=UPI00214B88E3|nr:glycosyltransferase family 2 protein [Ligilactobacillus apodemi]MCR1901925.1 glycosyltransferase family 2 protein [Ligilactobacillus apodemi]
MKKVCVVLVTYNRLPCLKKVLQGIKAQNHQVAQIFIFDNDSSDGTNEYLKENGFQIITNSSELANVSNDQFGICFRSSENLGGAGGFANAIKMAKELESDYLWIMDDDVYPEPDCLEILLDKMEKKHVQAVIPSRNDENYQDLVCLNIDFADFRKFWTWWRKQPAKYPLDKDQYFVSDMPFEGPLLQTELVRKIGEPDQGFFLEYDDSDYAQRILKHSKIVYATNAILHRQLAKKTATNATKKKEPYSWRMYYTLRNNIIFDRRYGKNWAVRKVSPRLLLLQTLATSIRDGHLKQNAPLIFKAYSDGIHERMGKRVDPDY